MRRFSSDTGQHGYVLVMLVLVLVVLLGIAALALDLGRLYVLRTEMQNAVDAAALAAAAELNAQEGALTRAEAAGRGLIQSDSHFAAADDKALLGEGDDIGFEFFTSIAPKTPTTNYADAHYVRVTLDPALDEDGESGRYGIDLFFLPVLNVLNIPTQRFVELTASALAGRHFYMCNYPPMMICDPLEAEGGLKENMDAGQQIVLKKQGGGSTWGIGMFGFLYPVDPETGEFLPGSSELGPYLADESKMGCTPPVVKTSTGNVANLSNAWNTRFDIYDKNPFNYPTAYQDYPPATNITDYGGYYNPSNTNQCAPAGYCESNPTEPMCWRDSALRCIPDDAPPYVGDGQWERDGYWQAKYGTPLPFGLAGATRHDIYEYEINNNFGFEKPVLAHQSVASAERRVMFVAVLSCEALGVKPNDVINVGEPDGFAKFFITERSAGSPANNFFVEYMGWAEERDEDFHVVIQLYE
jgi:hypothetical protein